MALCTQADIERKLQWDITAEPDSVVTDLIADAQALIEAEVGRELASAAGRQETFDGRPGTLSLKWWPVSAVSEVVEDGTTLDADDYSFYEDGRLIRLTGGGYQTYWRTRKPQSIKVTYTGGYASGTHDMELAHLNNLCAEVVARAFRQGAASAAQPAGVGLGGITAVSLDGSDSVQFSNPSSVVIELGGGLTRFVFLLDAEKAQLARYKPELVQ